MPGYIRVCIQVFPDRFLQGIPFLATFHSIHYNCIERVRNLATCEGRELQPIIHFPEQGEEIKMQKRSLTFLPTTKPGWWSLLLIIAMPVLIVIGTTFMGLLYPSVPAGGSILADIAARPALALTSLAAMTAGILAFITGLVAILRNKDRALLVFLASLVGALLLIFLAGEAVLPH